VGLKQFVSLNCSPEHLLTNVVGGGVHY